MKRRVRHLFPSQQHLRPHQREPEQFGVRLAHMADHIVRHIEAVGDFVAQLGQSESTDKVLRAQRSHIESMLASARLTIVEGAKIMKALSSAGFPEETKTQIASIIASRTSADIQSSVFSGRPTMQNYCTISAYFPKELWLALLDNKSTTTGQSLDMLLEVCIKLQLRYPTEPTLQHLIALHLVLSSGVAGATSMAPQLKYATLQHIKKTLRARAKDASISVVITELPADPAVFAKLHPDLFMSIYGRLAPSPAQVDLGTVSAIQATIPMRKTSKLMSSTSPAGPSGAFSTDHGAFQMLMQMFMQSMGRASSSNEVPIHFCRPQPRSISQPSLPEFPAEDDNGTPTAMSVAARPRQAAVEPAALLAAPQPEAPRPADGRAAARSTADGSRSPLSVQASTDLILAAIKNKRKETPREEVKAVEVQKKKTKEIKNSGPKQQGKQASTGGHIRMERSRNQAMARGALPAAWVPLV